MRTLWTGKKSFQVPQGRLRPSTFALKEIRIFQQRTDLLIPKKPFLRGVLRCILDSLDHSSCIIDSLDTLDTLDHCWCTHALLYNGLYSRQSRPFSTVSLVHKCPLSILQACSRDPPKWSQQAPHHRVLCHRGCDDSTAHGDWGVLGGPIRGR